MNLKHYIAIFIILSIHHINGLSGTTDSNSNCSEDNISLSENVQSTIDQAPETLTELMHTQQKLLQEKKYEDTHYALSRAFYNYYKKKKLT
jgi:hypothetical protein